MLIWILKLAWKEATDDDDDGGGAGLGFAWDFLEFLSIAYI